MKTSQPHPSDHGPSVASNDSLWLSQRIMYTAMEDEQKAEQLIGLLKSHRPAVDDVWIFTENDGQDFRYVPIDEVQRRAAFIAQRITRLREEGFGASIDVLNTIGHSDYADPFLIPLPWGGMQGPDGAISTCCSCPREPGFREYVREKYAAFAGCNPDWIWVDDDVRLFAHYWKVMHGCFCDLCLEEFSRRTGRSWTRDVVYAAIVRNDYPAINPDRDAWMHFLSDQLVEIHSLIRDAVHSVNPQIGLGGSNTRFSVQCAYYSRFKDRFEALRFTPAREIRVRPGGGAFTDERPLEAFEKAWGIAFQNTQYPPNTGRHAEVENYPFQFFEKSAAATVREASLYLAAGSEGIAFDMTGNLGNDPSEHRPYFQAVSGRRPYLEELRKAVAGGIPLGLNVAFHPEHAALSHSDGKSLDSTDAGKFTQACGWGYLGIPLRFARETEGPSVLHGQLAKGLPRDILELILKQGAVMDHEALTHLWAVGLGAAIGVKVKECYETGTFERFTDHPLNAGFANYTREVQQGYYLATSATLEGETCQPLSRLYNYRKEELGICAATVETVFGSRVAILGYRPWDYVGLPGKSAQCRKIVDWLHPDLTPARLVQGGKSVLFAYAHPSGRRAACFYNASEDRIEAPVIQGLEKGRTVGILFPDSTSQSAVSSSAGEVALPGLGAWGECLVTW